MDNKFFLGVLEKIGTWFDLFRAWLTKAWRIGILMAKGSYLVGERRRLFQKLGEDLYRSFSEQGANPERFTPTIQALNRTTKKIELEEVLIKNLRFGTREKPSHLGRPKGEGSDTEAVA